jgi:chromosome partitioning protein
MIVLIRSARAYLEGRADDGHDHHMSMIITVATMKGGSGKSTLASCLAVHWHLTGRRPTLIDADPQRSIMRLAARERALGGVSIVEDATEEASKTARRLAATGPVIIDTPGFRSKTSLECLAAADFVLVPVKPSPFDVDRMLDTLSILTDRPDGRRPLFRCLLTQTTRDSVIARHIRTELAEAGLPVLNAEMQNRVAYPEATLWGATPSLISWKGPAAREIATIADELDAVLGAEQAAA